MINTIHNQLQTLQRMASQLGFQLNPDAPQKLILQFYYGLPPQNNYRGNLYGKYCGNSLHGNFQNRSRDSNNSTSFRQFSQACTQNMVYGHCNRCGIGHLPSQCPNNQGSNKPTRSHPQANFATFPDNASISASTWCPYTCANTHTILDLSNLQTSKFYRGPNLLRVGDGNALPILHVGSSKLYSTHTNFNLSIILHVPK